LDYKFIRLLEVSFAVAEEALEPLDTAVNANVDSGVMGILLMHMD
jgi:hypothetical protein